MSMRDALSKLGLAPSEAKPAPEPAPRPARTPADWETRYAAGLWLAQGDRAEALLREALNAGTKRARADWAGAVTDAAWRLSGDEQAAAYACGLPANPGGVGLSGWADVCQGVLAALRSGAAKSRARAELAAAREAREAGEAAARAEREAEAAAKAEAAAQAAAEAAAIDAAVADLSGLPWAEAQEALHRSHREVAVCRSRAAWAAGLARPCWEVSEPPQSWLRLPLEVLAHYAVRGRTEARVLWEAATRPQEGAVVRDLAGETWFWSATGWGRPDYDPASQQAAARLRVGAVASTTPGPAGWWVQAEGKLRFAPPEVWTSMQFVRRETGGNCDVFQALAAWGRHPEDGSGRFSVVAWKARANVRADEQVARVLDALQLVQRADPGALRPEDYRVWAEARPAAGGWRLVAGRRGRRGAVVALLGGSCSRGWGRERAGYDAELAPGNRAFAAFAEGCSSGGGQSRWAVLGWLEEGGNSLLVQPDRRRPVHEYLFEGGQVWHQEEPEGQLWKVSPHDPRWSPGE